jgi:hypothetical protein
MSEAMQQAAEDSVRDGLDPSALNPNPGFFETDSSGALSGNPWYYTTGNSSRVPAHWTASYPQGVPGYPSTLTVYSRNLTPRNVAAAAYDVAVSLPRGDYNFVRLDGARMTSETFPIEASGLYTLSFWHATPDGITGPSNLLIRILQGGGEVFSKTYSDLHGPMRYHEESVPLAAGTCVLEAGLGRGTAGNSLEPPAIALLQLTRQAVTATNLAIAKGDAQAAFVGDQRFPEDLQVRATGNGNAAAVGAVVNLTINGSSGTTFASGGTTATRTTDNSGLTVPVGLIPGQQTGTFEVTASCPGTQPVTFHLALVPARNTFRFSADPPHIEITRGSSEPIRVILQSGGSSWPYIKIEGSLLQATEPAVFFFDRMNGPTDFPGMLPNSGNDYVVQVYASDDTGDHDANLYVHVVPDPNSRGPRQIFPLLRTDPRG